MTLELIEQKHVQVPPLVVLCRRMVWRRRLTGDIDFSRLDEAALRRNGLPRLYNTRLQIVS